MSEIVEDYRQSLNELTFNSRPIIDTLTTIANENKNDADGILNVIITRIYKCLPEQKLFTLYLLDSICKNVGNPYNILVGDEIFKLFSHVFLLVSDPIRQKMTNLFETWKLTKTKGTGLPLFPKQEMDKIQNFLNKAGAGGSNNGNGLTNSILIKDIDELFPVFQRKITSNPHDTKLKDRFNALNQLKILLQNQQMKVDELRAVQSQLQNIRQQELNNLNSSTNSPSPAPALPNSLPQIPRLPKSNKANDLFDQLVNFGILYFEQELKGPRIYEINYPKNLDSEPSNNLLEQILSNQLVRSEYEKLRLNELNKLKLKTDSLQSFISSSNISIQCKKLLYDSKELKCSICGKRFNNDETGITRKRLHLDWHFRINKKLKGSGSNVQSRNWYLDDIDWVNFKDEDLLEFQVDKPHEKVADIQVSSNEDIPYVVIPSSETNMNNKCLICREQIKGTFNDELGEWCWYNCIIPPGESQSSRRIVHATCFNETKKRNAQDDLNMSVKREKR